MTLPSAPSWDSGEHAGLCSVQKTKDEKGFHVRITGWKCAVDEEHAICQWNFMGGSSSEEEKFFE